MKVFAILLLAGAVAASHIPEMKQQGIVPVEAQAMQADQQSLEHGLEHGVEQQHHNLGRTQLFNVYSAPLLAREYSIAQEKLGLRGLFEKTFIAAFKPEGVNEIRTVLIRGGLRSLPFNKDAHFVRHLLASAPEKVALTLSAVKYLNMPELNMPITKLDVPANPPTNLESIFNVFRAEQSMFPFVLFANKEDVSLENLQKLSAIGELNLTPDQVQITRELPTVRQQEPASLFGGLIPARSSELTASYYPKEHLQQEPSSLFGGLIPARSSELIAYPKEHQHGRIFYVPASLTSDQVQITRGLPVVRKEPVGLFGGLIPGRSSELTASYYPSSELIAYPEEHQYAARGWFGKPAIAIHG